MSVLELKTFLLWCLGINYGVLLLWAGIFFLAHDWLYGLHGRRFRLSVETFDGYHYLGMTIYKVGVLLLNLAPWLALQFGLR